MAASVPDVPPAAAAAAGRTPTQGRRAPTAQPTGVAAASGVGAASGLATGLVVAGVPALPLLATQAAIVKALEEYLKALRWSNEDWVRRTVTPRLAQQDVFEVVADENARQLEFERKSRIRLARDLPRVYAIADPVERRRALEKVLERERVFARFRAESMAVRAIAAVDRVVIREESPQGAFWRLGHAVQHTADCIAMAGKFWPWVVLDDFHPPTHPGCRCSLHSFAVAVEHGWMQPGDVQPLDVAMRRAAAAKALLHEDELVSWEGLRDAVVRTGLGTGAGFAGAVRALLGG